MRRILAESARRKQLAPRVDFEGFDLAEADDGSGTESRDSAMGSSDQAGPPSAASALSRMRAWVSCFAAALSVVTRSCSGFAFLGGQSRTV
jgi:hypothetical protein